MDYLNALIEGLGVSLGIVAGTVVAVLVRLYSQRRKETQQTRNLRFELELDIKKIETWLEEIGRYRNAINGDSLHNYFGCFDIGRAVFVTANAMLQSGLLYKKLSHDEIGKLQVIAAELSPNYEQLLTDRIASNTRTLVRCRADDGMGSWMSHFKPQAVAHVDFWERKFKTHKQTLQDIVRSLR